ncbi:hypothetical protein BC828DRAFT_393045 [Blastocladiella britannica]|nr:hypothetical protein BC828DRAFT_393045 [Blastocladiella britannica]
MPPSTTGLTTDDVTTILFYVHRGYLQSALSKCDALIKAGSAAAGNATAADTRRRTSVTMTAAAPSSAGANGTETRTIPGSTDPNTASYYSFWRAAILVLMARPLEAIRELVVLQDEPALRLAAAAALLLAHRRCPAGSQDREAIATLDATLTIAESNPTTIPATAYFSLAAFLAAAGDPTEARRILGLAQTYHCDDPWTHLAAAWTGLLTASAAGGASAVGQHPSLSSVGLNNKGDASWGSGMASPGADRGSLDSVQQQQRRRASEPDNGGAFALDPLAEQFPEDPGVLATVLLLHQSAGFLGSDRSNDVTAQLLAVRTRSPVGLLIGLLDAALAKGDWDAVSDACGRVLGVDAAALSGRPGTAGGSTVLGGGQRPSTGMRSMGAGSGGFGSSGGTLFVPTIDAHLVTFLVAALRDGSSTRASAAVAALAGALKREEPDSIPIHIRVLGIVSRLPTGVLTMIPTGVMRDLTGYAERGAGSAQHMVAASGAAPGPATTTAALAVCVLARMQQRQGQWARAKQIYAQAVGLDSACVPALEGAARCELALAVLSGTPSPASAMDGLDSNANITTSTSTSPWTALVRDTELILAVAPRSPTAHYLHAEVAWLSARNATARMASLRTALEATIHFISASSGGGGSNGGSGLDVLVRADLALLEDIMAAALDMCPMSPRTTSSRSINGDDGLNDATGSTGNLGSSPIMSAIHTLAGVSDVVHQLFPASPDAMAAVAWADLVRGRSEKAQEMARAALDRTPGHWGATCVLVHELMLRVTQSKEQDPLRRVLGSRRCQCRNNNVPDAADSADPAAAASHVVDDAMSLLDSALAVSLELRRNDGFHVLRARVCRALGDKRAARAELAASSSAALIADGTAALTARDRLVYWTERLHHASWEQDASSLIRDVTMSGRRSLATYPWLAAELNLEAAKLRAATDPEGAIAALREVVSADPGLAHACAWATAEAYQQGTRDSRAYVRACLAQLDADPASKQAHLHLAAAYLAADDVDRAVDTLTSALCYFPESMDLHRAIADVLIAAHEYQRAIEYLQDAAAGGAAVSAAVARVTGGSNGSMNTSSRSGTQRGNGTNEPASLSARAPHIVALARLYLQLGQHRRAEVLLIQTLQDAGVAVDADTVVTATTSAARAGGSLGSDDEAEIWDALATAQLAMGKRVDASAAWRRAADRARTPAKRAAAWRALAGIAESPQVAETALEAARAADPTHPAALIGMVEVYLRQRRPDVALAAAKEAVAKWPKNEQAVRAMARVLVQQRHFDTALQYMRTVVVVAGSAAGEDGMDSDSGAAGDDRSALAALMDRVVSTGGATSTATKGRLISTPSLSGGLAAGNDSTPGRVLGRGEKINCEVLADMLDLLHRQSRLAEAKMYLDLDGSGSTTRPGLQYCTGLYHRYMGDVREAVLQFKKSRSDVRWRVRSITQILEMLLFPDLNAPERPIEAQVLHAAGKLIEQLPAGPERKIWEAYAAYGPRSKPEIEKAIESLRTNVHADNSCGTLAVAIGHMLAGNVSKFKSALKAMAGREWSFEEAAWLETGWLLLAQHYLEAGKPEAADALVRSCLDVNPHGGGARAFSLYASVAESAGKPDEAAECWHRAWNEGQRSDPHVGARLALALLNCDRPTACIPVVLHALQQLHKRAGFEGAELEDPVVHIPASAVAKLNNAGAPTSPSSTVGETGTVPVRLRTDILDRARASLRP